ncbi:hypothetical protein J2M53_16615 [Arthrobacter sp. zg-ZUI100]|uniref:DUF4064 domain-containing protein n=1 Tax=Arthrobacter jiangjiafuii TaxID=2817475 RepID=A0A975M671_9MICC|nr:hypothetical protein [Arthrobacter jiangjiafuii]MBP3037863.1 hypothetical protein [Arthrobacter jiangjiafuii]MBP3045026.1 hypothetical protein [Arthrobacter jiangjiafuii]QWC10647.1 hypothetical protein KKR91_03150 [Arthrobacter jiangjiafuii]
MSEQVPQVPPAPQDNNYSYNSYAGGQMPGAPAAAPVPPKRPKQVDSSFVLLMITLVLTVISVPAGIAFLASDENKAAMQADAAAAGFTLDLDVAIAAGAMVLVVMGIICFAITLLVAIFIRKGHNWARIVLAVYAGLSVLTLLTGTNLLGWWGILLMVAATVPLFLKPAPAYFSEMKQYRLSRKFSQVQ